MRSAVKQDWKLDFILGPFSLRLSKLNAMNGLRIILKTKSFQMLPLNKMDSVMQMIYILDLFLKEWERFLSRTDTKKSSHCFGYTGVN